MHLLSETVFPPVLGKRLQAQTVAKGERARLEIEVTGTPEPTVTWYKDDQQIKSSDLYRIITQGNSHLLLIDAGRSQCEPFTQPRDVFTAINNPSLNSKNSHRPAHR